jgi:hypothetical protein
MGRHYAPEQLAERSHEQIPGPLSVVARTDEVLTLDLTSPLHDKTQPPIFEVDSLFAIRLALIGTRRAQPMAFCRANKTQGPQAAEKEVRAPHTASQAIRRFGALACGKLNFIRALPTGDARRLPSIFKHPVNQTTQLLSSKAPVGMSSTARRPLYIFQWLS